MSYVWEDYSDKREYRIGDKICPYIEVLNQNTEIVSVNPLLRFSRIFNTSFLEGAEDRFALDTLTEHIGDEGTGQIINVLFHYLAQLDKLKGLDASQRSMERLRNEIERGLWGEKVQRLFRELTNSDRECLLYVLSRRICNDNRSYFMEAIGKAFPVSSLCFEKKTELYYLYIASEESDYNAKKLDLIKLLFWTVNRNLKVVWNYHYGIVGCDDTMHIGSIQIV